MARLRLLDTNAMIALNQGQLSVGAEDSIAISFITRLELLSWPDADETELADLRGMIDAIDTIPFSGQIEDEVIKLRSARLLKLPDAIVRSHRDQYWGRPRN
jgi:predicted nucleic acid-binding protein